MTLTFAEIARWHARRAIVTTGADRNFHAEAARLLHDLANRRAKHGRNITAALAKRKAQGKRLGRPRIDPAIEKAIKASLQAGGKGDHAIARKHGVSRGTVQRIKKEMLGRSRGVKKARLKMRSANRGAVSNGKRQNHR